MIVCSEDDIEVELGEVAVGEVRPRAFAELARALDEEHLLSLAWLALADLAVWPQLPVPEAAALAYLLETGGYRLAQAAEKPKDAAALALQCTFALLPFIEQIDRRVRNHSVDSTVDLTPLWLTINQLASESGDPTSYWEKWLRRVVPAAATIEAERAKSLAAAALRATFTVPQSWKYVASIEAVPRTPKGSKGVRVAAVSIIGGGTSEVTQVGVFVDQDPVNRRIATTFTPEIPVDSYRIGYLFQSVYMTDLLDDERTGYYDSVKCVNAVTGETWSYSRF